MASKAVMLTSPCCMSTAARAPPQERQSQCISALPQLKANIKDTRCVLPHVTTVAVLEHASAKHATLLLAGLANAHSQRTRLEEPNVSKAQTQRTITTATEKSTMECGTASGLPAPGGEPLVPIMTTPTSPRRMLKAERALPQEQHCIRTRAQPKHKRYDDDCYPTFQSTTPTVKIPTTTSDDADHGKASQRVC